MPTIKKIMAADASCQRGMVIGFEEGNFIRMYEHSAWQMALLHGLKPTKRLFKNVGLEIVSVGFPQTSRLKYLPSGERSEDGIWRMALQSQVAIPFEEWKASVPLTVSEQRQPHTATVDKLTQVSGLPVFKATYDLMLYVMGWINNVERTMRYTVGQDLVRGLTDVQLCIYRANKESADRRVAHVESAQSLTEEAMIYLRLLYDMRQIALPQYAHTAELAAEVEKQLANWRRALGGNGEVDILSENKIKVGEESPFEL